MQKLTVIRPAHAHHAYEIAAQTFADLAKKVGDVEVTTITDYERDSLADDGSTLVLIGSDQRERRAPCTPSLSACFFIRNALDSLAFLCYNDIQYQLTRRFL